MASKSNAKASAAIERYARENISQRSDMYGQFMYHAELIRRGHTTIHARDMRELPSKWQQVLRDLRG